MKEKTTIFVVMTGDTPEAAFSSEELADMFIKTHERDYNTYIQPLELDKADNYFDPEQHRRHKEDFDEIQKAVLRKINNEEESAENTRQETSKVPPITSYGECTHPNRKCECRKDGKCPDAQMAIQFCRNCSDEDLQKADEFAKSLPHALKQIAEEKERVNHPKHYQHPSGVECITVARHHDFNTGNALKYLWRAGLKQEQGIPPADRQTNRRPQKSRLLHTRRNTIPQIKTTRKMKEIKIQLRHAKIDAPLECTTRVCDDEFFIENENFAPIEIENTRFVPVEERTYAIIRSFLAVHKDEWRDMVTTYGYFDYVPPIYEKIRQNNVREWQQERLSKKQQNQ